LKQFKKNGKVLNKHEISCLFNPKNSPKITLNKFKQMLPKEGACPNCNEHTKKLRSHALNCFSEIKDFSPFLQLLLTMDKCVIKNKIAHEVKAKTSKHLNLLKELPFFDYLTQIKEKEENVFKSNTYTYKNKNSITPQLVEI
jgi:hypothetical protein